MMKKVGVILGFMVLLIGNVNIRATLSQYYSYETINPDLNLGYRGSGGVSWGVWDNSSWNGFNNNPWSGGGTNWNTLYNTAGTNWTITTWSNPGSPFGLGSNSWSGGNSNIGNSFGSPGLYQSGWTGSGNILWGSLDYSGWSYPSGNSFDPSAGNWPNRTAQSYIPTSTHYEEDIPTDTLVLRIHQLVNEYRSSKDLSSLIYHEVIAQQAQNHSLNMLKDNVASGEVVISHDGFSQRVAEIAKVIPYRGAAENVAYNKGYSDPAQKAVNGWISSPGHRENMEGNYSLTGIGISGDSQSGYYFTQIFIHPQNER